MQRRGRIVVAAGVLLVGIVVAMLFRHPQAPNPRSLEPPSDPLLLRKEIGSPVERLPAERPTVRIESPPTVRRSVPAQPPTILLPMDPGQPPPDLAKTYPGSVSTPAVRWENSVALGTQSPPSGSRAVRKHKVVDGDTLGALAQRYLGNAQRSGEIFEANKDVLSRPDLLPIGAELKIPSPAPAPAASPVPATQRPLVPILQGRQSTGV
jgi:nucleoid-associated protein YgaU